MTALPDTLQPNLLYFFVFGPGTGETALLRIPPDQWIIIDSFKCAKRPAGEFVIEKYGGHVASIVLTHPHQDHYPGILELIDNYGDAILGCVHPKDSGSSASLAVDPAAVLRERAKPTYVRIWDEWEANASRRWDTFRHTYRDIGEARVMSLHPKRPVNRNSWSNDPNEISSAMFVEWHGLRLLLGADVPNTRWPEIAEEFQSVNLGNHMAMKVPHHGSREAIHGAFGVGLKSRCWIITPFQRSKLPRAEDLADNPHHGPEGLAKILLYVTKVNLTSLPFRHDCETLAPCKTSRQAIRDRAYPIKTGLVNENLTRTTAALDRHVIVAFDKTGTIQELWYGAGTVLVHDGNGEVG